MTNFEMAQICKALGDENRLAIVKMLAEEEKCGCTILTSFHFTQPTFSHHMKILVECGLVIDRRDGKWHLYSLNEQKLDALQECLAILKEESIKRKIQ